MTKFKHGLRSLETISGSIPEDKKVADEAAKEMEEFAKNQYAIIMDYVELREVVTASDEHRLHDALTAIRHIDATLGQICSFFEDSSLLEYVRPPRNRVHKILKKSEEEVPKLLMLISRTPSTPKSNGN